MLRVEGLYALNSNFILNSILNRVVLKSPNLKKNHIDVLQNNRGIGARSDYFGSLGHCFVGHR